jgi:hypothetical protein
VATLDTGAWQACTTLGGVTASHDGDVVAVLAGTESALITRTDVTIQSLGFSGAALAGTIHITASEFARNGVAVDHSLIVSPF